MKICISLLLTVTLAAASMSAAQNGSVPAPPAQTAQPPQAAAPPPAVPQEPVLTSPAVPLGPPPPSYVIGPQDVLKITVVEEGPELQNQLAIVGDDGNISFWALKTIQAGGKTTRELQDRIAAMLADGFIRNPVVRVEIDKYKSQYVTILGEVRTQVRIPMQGTKSLLEALAEAGGPTSNASNDAKVSHTVGKEETIDLRDLQAAQVYMLHDGDVVVVQKAQQFYINGEVRNQGVLLWQRNMTLTQAVTLAGGLTDRGTYRGASATRVVQGKSLKVDLKQESMILPDDVIKMNKRFF